MLFFLIPSAVVLVVGILAWIFVSSEGLSVRAVRRLYLFIVAFLALNVAALGALNLLSTLLRPLLEPSAILEETGFVRDQIAFGISQIVVALPIWLVHWLAAQRAAAREPEDARSLLRVLYLYLVLATAALIGLFQGVFLLRGLFAYPAGLASAATLRAIIHALGWLGIYGVIWAYHRPIALRLDLTPSGRTLWRWQVYILSAFGLAMFAWGIYWLVNAELDYLLTQGQALLMGSPRSALATYLVSYGPQALVGGAWWLFFWRRAAERDTTSRLREVYIFLSLAVALAATLVGSSWILYQGLRFLLGYRAPEGIVQARFLADAVPLLILGGLGWVYHHAVIEAAAPGEQSMATTPGRVYFYLVAAAGLILLAIGLSNILSTLLEFAFQVFQEIGGQADWWRDQLSLALVMAVVGLPVWLVHWRLMQYMAAAHADERQTLPRRVFVYGVLLIGVLAVLVFLGLALNDLLRLILGEPVSRRMLSSIFNALGNAAIAGAIVAYHWQIARTDMALAGSSEPRPVRKRVMVLLEPQQRPFVPDLEAALGGPVEVLEQVGGDGAPAVLALSPEMLQSLAASVQQAPSDRVLVLFRSGGAEIYPFK